MRELLENGCGGCGKRAILAEAKEDTTHDLIKGQPATQSGFSASLRDPIRCVLSLSALKPGIKSVWSECLNGKVCGLSSACHSALEDAWVSLGAEVR